MALSVVSFATFVVLQINILTDANLRHDVIAACELPVESIDPAGDAYQKCLRPVFDETAIGCTAQSGTARKDCYRRRLCRCWPMCCPFDSPQGSWHLSTRRSCTHFTMGGPHPLIPVGYVEHFVGRLDVISSSNLG